MDAACRMRRCTARTGGSAAPALGATLLHYIGNTGVSYSYDSATGWIGCFGITNTKGSARFRHGIQVTGAPMAFVVAA